MNLDIPFFSHLTGLHTSLTNTAISENMNVRRCMSSFLVAGMLFFGTSNQACLADPPTPKDRITPKGGNSKAIAAQLLLYMSAEAAEFVGKAILSQAMKDLREGKYTAKLVTVIPLPDTLGPCLSIPKSFEVVMTATSEGKPVSNDPLSRSVPYDPNARVFMTSIVKVEVAAFYPIRDIRYTDGKLVLPDNPVIIAGYRGKEGERSTWQYHGGAGWNDDKRKAVANDLTLKALDVARDQYARSLAVTTEELTKTFEKAVNQHITEVTKGLERRKP